MSNKARVNYALDAVIAIAFIISAASGLVLWLDGPGGYRGGRNPAYREAIVGLSRATWNDLHAWVSLVMMAGIGLHLVLHWQWIWCTTRGLLSPPRRQAEDACPTA